ncbi:MAG: hypothetical protein GTO04_05825, partial [Planctomycetales bacterium]|nr:hypothetical protein [Planctomycetales bacterium]
QIAQITGGHHHHCEDAAELPDVLAADARKVATPGPFVPRVFGELPGIDLAGLPPLNAYAMTSPRPEAELLL